MIEYNVGDVIEYQPFAGPRRIVTVENKEDNIKNGYSGFDAVEGYWGYDDQIIRVVSRSKK